MIHFQHCKYFGANSIPTTPHIHKYYQRYTNKRIYPSSSSLSVENPTTTAPLDDDTNKEAIIRFFRDRYSISERKQVASKVQTAIESLQEHLNNEAALDTDKIQSSSLVPQLSIQHDILPKIELLDSLQLGLGWRVFSRYPAEFSHPDAGEYWQIMAASLYAIDFSPERITRLFAKHPSLFAHCVRSPGNLRKLFEWLGRDIGIEDEDIARIVDRAPLLLQTDCDFVLKPRLDFLIELGLAEDKIGSVLKRQPELLLVDPNTILERVECFQKHLLLGGNGETGEKGGLTMMGIDGGEVGRMLASHPSVFLSNIAITLPFLTSYLHHHLNASSTLQQKLILKGDVLTRSLGTIEKRVDYWLTSVGVTKEQLCTMLDRFPRLLIYPMEEERYVKKIDFLNEWLELNPITSLVTFPQYVSYSLSGRIAPRAAAVIYLGGGGGGEEDGANDDIDQTNRRKKRRRRRRSTLLLSHLALSDAAFCTNYGFSEEEYQLFLQEWPLTELGKTWH
jgi:hypothetical protein